jgi:hypothetical protein
VHFSGDFLQTLFQIKNVRQRDSTTGKQGRRKEILRGETDKSRTGNGKTGNRGIRESGRFWAKGEKLQKTVRKWKTVGWQTE